MTKSSYNPLISIVSPVYNAEQIVDLLVQRISEEVSKITPDYEIILVEDGSPDNSWAAIERNCKKDSRVKGIKLSRNFGQHYAITAGLDHAQGEWVVVMDCDLQDRPEEIINLYNKAKEGYDIVLARRYERKDTLFKRFFSWAFYQILSYLTATKHDPAIANFGIYHKKVIQAVCQMRESIRVFPIMVRWLGFKTVKLDVMHAERVIGTTTYNFKRLLNLALDIMLAYSDKPIRLTIKLGLMISLFSFLFAIFLLYEYVSGIITVPGYASIIISIWFLSGLIIMTLGVIGLYVGKTFEGVRNRPIYIISNKLNES
jgi:dolichol-phosphate mannosyltransferase